MSKAPNGKVERISVSLSGELLGRLDAMVNQRGFESRSQALSEMIHQQLAEYDRHDGSQIMTGTITLFYSHAKPNIKNTLADIQYKYINEVISSLHVLLEDQHTMEVLLVQGPARRLRKISDELITCKGVKTGSLTLTSLILPPIHPLPKG